MKTIKKNLIFAAVFAIPLIIASCKKSDSPAQASKPTITTNIITSITANSATSGGFIGDSSTLYKIAKRGILYNSLGDPTGSFPSIETNDMYNTSADWGNFPSSLTGLTSNTTYYVRAYVFYKNTPGVSYPPVYGELRTFKTLP
mgnify:CR=1 FL=1